MNQKIYMILNHKIKFQYLPSKQESNYFGIQFTTKRYIRDYKRKKRMKSTIECWEEEKDMRARPRETLDPFSRVSKQGRKVLTSGRIHKYTRIIK